MYKKNSIYQSNTKEKFRFSLRKITIGVVSVLLGTAIYWTNSNSLQSVNADAVTNTSSLIQTNDKQQKQDSISSSDHIVSDQPSDTIVPANSSADKHDTTNDNMSATDAQSTNSQTDNSNTTNKTPTTDITNNEGATDSTSQNNDTNNTDQATQNENVSNNGSQTDKSNKTTDKVKKIKTKTKLSTTTAEGLTGEYDTTTGTLTISGTATIDRYTDLFDIFFYDYNFETELKHIIIKDKIILKKDAPMALFAELRSLVDITGLENLDTSQATDMSNMFSSCWSLTSLNLTNFDTTNVKHMSSMFDQCRSLTNLDLNSFNTSKVINMDNMFDECWNLTSLDLSKFDTSQVLGMTHMFHECKALKTINLHNFNTSKITNMEYMFADCQSLVNLDLSSFDTKQVYTMDEMFQGCSSLYSLDISNFNTAGSMETGGSMCSIGRMFQGCNNLSILKLGPKTHFQHPDYYQPNRNDSVGLKLQGLWFKQERQDLPSDIEKQKGRTSDDLINNYKPTTDYGTYARGYKYQVHYYDQDNNNQPIPTNVAADLPTSILVLLSQQPAGVDIGKGLAIQQPAKIKDALKYLADHNYNIADSPFNPAFVPTSDKDAINLYFTHNIQKDTETRTRKLVVHYRDAKGNKLAPDTVQEKQFTRIKSTDLITNKTNTTDWTVDNAQTTDISLPVINGYITDKRTVPSQTLTIDQDVEITATYQKLGSYVPIDKDGKPIAGIDNMPYANDPNDPTKITANQKLPNIDGYVTKDTLTAPKDPTKDTPVTYLKTNQTVISFIDQDNQNRPIDNINNITNSHQIGQTIHKSAIVDQIVNDLLSKGYELVNDPFDKSVTAMEGEQNLQYIFKHKTDKSQTENIISKQIIHFVDKNGNKLIADKVTEVGFSRTGVKDLVTGKIIWQKWSKPQTLPKIKLPVIKGYITSKPQFNSQTITADKDVETTIIYQKLGSYVPVDEHGNMITGVDKIPYANDLNDPTKIDNNQKLPNINGYTTPKLIVPKDLTKDTNIIYYFVSSNSSHKPIETNDNSGNQKPNNEPSEPNIPTDNTNETSTNQHHNKRKPINDVQTVASKKNQLHKLIQTLSPQNNAISSAYAKNVSSSFNQAKLPQTGISHKNNILTVILGLVISSLSLYLIPERKKK